MLVNNITWVQFATYTALAAGVYYAGLILTRKINVIPRKSNPMSPPDDEGQPDEKVFWHPASTPYSAQQSDSDETEQEQPTQNWEQDDEDDHSFEALQMLANDIERIVSDQQSYPDKDSIMEALSTHVALYPVLNTAAFKSAVGNIIIKAVKVERDIEVTKTETDTLWEQPE